MQIVGWVHYNRAESDRYHSGSLLKYAYALENKSEHPLARAILKKKQNPGKCRYRRSYDKIPGSSWEWQLTAILDGHTLYGGNHTFISSKVSVDGDIRKKAEKLAEEENTIILRK